MVATYRCLLLLLLLPLLLRHYQIIAHHGQQ
jgi:hypothetical protein